MSDSSEDQEELRLIAWQYFNELLDFEYVSVESLKRSRLVAKDNKAYINSLFPGKNFLHFLQKFPDMFFIENGKVAQYDISLECHRTSAIEYFEEILKQYLKPVRILNLKGHVGQADVDVLTFINTFYPGQEFKHFLQSYPDAFVVYRKNTVWSTAKACVQFYTQLLNKMGEGVYYYTLLTNSHNALPQIKTFLYNNYPGEQFRDFLEENSEHFHVDENGFVDFSGIESDNSEDESDEDESDEDENDEPDIEEEAVDFFKEKLENCSYYPGYMKLRAYNSQAVKRIKDYIDENYPGEEFMLFLQSQPHHFTVHDDDTVVLTEQECLSFLTERLNIFGGGLHFSTLNIHASEAHPSVRKYIRKYYPDNAFRTCLEDHPERFTVDKNGFVFLSDDENEPESDGESSCDIETAAAEYFERFLHSNDPPPHYMNLRGHIGQASEDVIDFINDSYPNEDFVAFLSSQPDFFVMYSDGTVRSTENEAVNYFEDILEEIGGEIYWYNLQLHLQQAEPFLKDFFLNNYPGGQFKVFLQSNEDVFTCNTDGLVGLREVSQAQDFDDYF